MQLAFPEGILIPGLKPVKSVRARAEEPVLAPCESEFAEFNLRELSIMAKSRGRK